MDIDKLIEARKRWNQLSDCIYELAAGDLDNSRFSVIYNNYEDEIRDKLCAVYPYHADFLRDYFSGIILEMTEEGYAFVYTNEEGHAVRWGNDLIALLEGDQELSYKERY